MKALKYWARNIITDALLAVLFVLWVGYGWQGAGNVFLFVAWGLAIVRVLIGLNADKTGFPQRPAGFGVYHWITEGIAIIAMAWFALFWLAGVYAAGTLLSEAARKREPKKPVEEQP